MLIGGGNRRTAPTTPPVVACAKEPELFTAELLDAPPSRSRVRKQAWDEYVALRDRARQACAACPVLAECLYTAVVQVDVSGFVACTTGRERHEIRRLLGVSVEADDLDVAAGVRPARAPIDHDSVLAARQAYPDDSLEELAVRLECSLSTVKRHLRRSRAAAAGGAQAADAAGASGGAADGPPDAAAYAGPAPTTPGVPTVADVLDAFDAVVEPTR